VAVPPSLPVVVSGIQPSGTLHLGNYFGALRQHVALADDESRRAEAYYFIVNYHALTSLHDREALERYTFDVALDYLALGFDPEKAHLFVQSDVPQVTELTWIFLCLTPVSRLELGVSYKDKVDQGLPASGGLLTYPVLQAADILIYGEGASGLVVPVGADQRQHIEMTRDTASRFNAAFGPEEDPLFVLPEPLILDEVAVVPGTDGRKMSKSYGNAIGIFEEGAELKRSVMGIVTDSTPLEAPKDPEGSNIVALYKLVAPPEEVRRMEEEHRAGGVGYGEFKKRLFEALRDYFAPMRARREEILARPGYVDEVLADGAARAREIAGPTMERVKRAVGLM